MNGYGGRSGDGSTETGSVRGPPSASHVVDNAAVEWVAPALERHRRTDRSSSCGVNRAGTLADQAERHGKRSRRAERHHARRDDAKASQLGEVERDPCARAWMSVAEVDGSIFLGVGAPHGGTILEVARSGPSAVWPEEGCPKRAKGCAGRAAHVSKRALSLLLGPRGPSPIDGRRSG